MTGPGMTSWPILTVDIVREAMSSLRVTRAQNAELIGFETQDQTGIATAVSEIARNAFEYASRGLVDFQVHCPEGAPQQFLVAIKDNGPGIPDLDAVLEGRFKSFIRYGRRTCRREAARRRVSKSPARRAMGHSDDR